jgi:hypothetical protein
MLDNVEDGRAKKIFVYSQWCVTESPKATEDAGEKCRSRKPQ